MGEFATNTAIHAAGRQSSSVSDPSHANSRIQFCNSMYNNNINTVGDFLNNTSVQAEERKPCINHDGAHVNLLKVKMCQPACAKCTAVVDEFSSNGFTQTLGKKLVKSQDLTHSAQSDLYKIQMCHPLSAETLTEYIPDEKIQQEERQALQSCNGTTSNKIQNQLCQPVDTCPATKNDETTSPLPAADHEGISTNNSDSPMSGLFADLWNGHPITLPTHSWALHRVKNTGVGPLVIINEMMANGHGIPFPLKQFVMSSSGGMMAVVLNQVIDVNLLSVLPLQTIEDLQEALKYFDKIECDYVYLEHANM